MPNIFCDWSVNKSNWKGRFVLIFFRLASFVSTFRGPFFLFAIPVGILYRLIVEWILGVELPWHTKVGDNLRIYHGQSLVINDNAIIGANCVLRHSTTIGYSFTDSELNGGAPTLSDGVDVGANVVILGPIKIGVGAIIGAGSVVVRDVPDYAVVVGNPARIIRYVDRKDII